MGCHICGKVKVKMLIVEGGLYCRDCINAEITKGEGEKLPYPRVLHLVVWDNATCSDRDDKTTTVLKAVVNNVREHTAISDYAVLVAERYLDIDKGFDDVGDVLNQKVELQTK